MTSPGRSPPRPKKESSADADDEVESTAPLSGGRRRLDELARRRPHPTLLPGVVTAGAVAAAADALESDQDDRQAPEDRSDETHGILAESDDTEAVPDRAALRAQAKADRLAARQAKREERRRRREERRAPVGGDDELEPDDERSDDGEPADEVVPDGAAAVAAATTDPKVLRAEARARRREEARRAKQAEAEQARLEAEERAEREAAEREAAAELAERERTERVEREAAERAEREAAERAAAEQAEADAGVETAPDDGETPDPVSETVEHPVIEWTDPADDAVVEPPPSVVESDDARTPGRWRRAVAPAVLTIAMLALVASVVLAIGALLAAISADTDNAVVGAISSVCDVLDGPLNGLVDFSGENAVDKERLLSRGIASMVFLAIGVLLPLAVSSKDDDD